MRPRQPTLLPGITAISGGRIGRGAAFLEPQQCRQRAQDRAQHRLPRDDGEIEEQQHRGMAAAPVDRGDGGDQGGGEHPAQRRHRRNAPQYQGAEDGRGQRDDGAGEKGKGEGHLHAALYSTGPPGIRGHGGGACMACVTAA